MINNILRLQCASSKLAEFKGEQAQICGDLEAKWVPKLDCSSNMNKIGFMSTQICWLWFGYGGYGYGGGGYGYGYG